MADIQVDLEINGAPFVLNVMRATQVLQQLGLTARTAGAHARSAQGPIDGLYKSLGKLSIAGLAVVGAFTTLKAVFYDWQMGIVNTNAKIERMQVLFVGLSKAPTPAAQFADANAKIAQMLDLAKRAPFAMDELTNSYVKFTAVNLANPLRMTKALSDAVASFGGNDESLHRASVAVTQMAGKGVISMEELRQQLGEAIPNAINIMARSLNVSYSKLVAMVSSGSLAAGKGLDALMTGIEKEMPGAAERMMDTWSGMTSRLKTTWLEFQLEVGQNGFFEKARGTLRELIAMLETPAAAEFGRRLGEGMAHALEVAVDIVKWTIANGEAVVTWTANALVLYGTYRLIRGTLVSIAALNVAMNLGALRVAIASIAGFVGSLGLVGGALALISTGALAAGAAIFFMSDGVDKFGNDVGRLQDSWETISDFFEGPTFDQWRLAWDDLWNALPDSIGKVEFGDIFDGWTDGMLEWIADIPTIIKKATIVLTAEFSNLVDTVSTNMDILWLKAGQSIKDNMLKLVPEGTIKDRLVGEVSERNAKTNAKIDEANSGLTARTDARDQLVLDEIKAIEERAAAQRKGSDETRKIKDAEEELANARRKSTEGIKRHAEAYESETEALRKVMPGINATIESMDAAMDKLVGGRKESIELNDAIAERDRFVKNIGDALAAYQAPDFTGDRAKATASAIEDLNTVLAQFEIQITDLRKKLSEKVGKDMSKEALATLGKDEALIKRAAEKYYKLPPYWLDTVLGDPQNGGRGMESNVGDPATILGVPITKKKSMHYGDRARGRGQFMTKTLAAFLRAHPGMGYDDVPEQIMATAQLAADNARIMGSNDPGDLYRAHLAGAGWKKKGLDKYGRDTSAEFDKRYAEKLAKAPLGDTDAEDAMADIAKKQRLAEEETRKLVLETADIRSKASTERVQIEADVEKQLSDLRLREVSDVHSMTDAEAAIRAEGARKITELERQTANDTMQMRLSLLDTENSLNDRILAIKGQAAIEMSNLNAQTDLDDSVRKERQAILTAKLNKDLAAEIYRDWNDAMEGVGSTIGNAFGEFAKGNMTAKDSLRSVIEALRDMMVQLVIITPIAREFKRIMSITSGASSGGSSSAGWLSTIASAAVSIFTGGSGAGTGTTVTPGSLNVPASASPFAMGGSFMASLPSGIYTSPTTFPLSSYGLHKFANGTGLLGEAGPEAVVPLDQMSNGKLGINASGMSGGTTINIINNGASEGWSARAKDDGNGKIDIEFVKKQIVSELTRGIMEGGHPTSDAMQSAFGLQRRGR